MKLVTFARNGEEQVGVLNQAGDRILPAVLAGVNYGSMNELIRHMTAEERKALEQLAVSKQQGLGWNEVVKCAPIPEPAQDVLCLGINYKSHAEEAGQYSREAFAQAPQAIYFSKRVNRATADGEAIDSHPGLVSRLDYEAELGVVIGRDALHVKAEDAFSYVFGYTVINDVSARALQTSHKQWYFGKSLDTFTPMGPCIVTADEIPAPPALRISCFVNGELRQDASTDLLITDIPKIISELTAGMMLKAGTIIATGTPAGVGMGMNPPRFLVPGDRVECRIEKIGSLINIVK